MRLLKTIILCSFSSILCAAQLDAQNIRPGVSLGVDKAGISVAGDNHKEGFFSTDLYFDYGVPVFGHESQPGIRATGGYNFVLSRKEHRSGSSIWFLGPGITLGYAGDFSQPYGIVFGVNGNIGYEYDFHGPVSIVARLVPTIAFHVGASGGSYLMDYWREGLLSSISPQVGIYYSLAERKEKPYLGKTDSHRDGYSPLVFTYGVEFTASLLLATFYHRNFHAIEGFRINQKGGNIGLLTYNGAVLAHAGADIGKHLNLSVYAGYGSLNRGYKSVPVSLRGTWKFGKDRFASGWIAFADAGTALCRDLHSPALFSKLGGGWRVVLSERARLDFTLAWQLLYGQFPFIDENEIVRVEMIRRNDNFHHSLNFSIGITL